MSESSSESPVHFIKRNSHKYFKGFHVTWLQDVFAKPLSSIYHKFDASISTQLKVRSATAPPQSPLVLLPVLVFLKGTQV